jgi:hypothetical protein
MNRRDNFSKYESLRKDFPHFHYDSYEYNVLDNQIIVSFQFSVPGHFIFRPRAVLKGKSEIFRNAQTSSAEMIENLVFHIGMIELVSYWKAVCSPVVTIPGKKLSKDQEYFWKKLYFNGLGEFFYINKIETDIESFMQIDGFGNGGTKPGSLNLEGPALVPVGGGKDSAVTLDLLTQSGIPFIPFAINPLKATEEVLSVLGRSLEEAIIIERQIDPLLIELNTAGYLNGHTPFSAVVAFYSLFAAILSGSSEIILSNESSANEPTIPGTRINHQYSKTVEFEKDFREYVHRFISPSFNYFSLLRSLTELQIAHLFSKNHDLNPVFRSCNRGSKNGIWCGECPKCLFTWIILSPFIDQEALKKIFGKDMLEDVNLIPILDELSGNSEVKPFECIGTIDEVRVSLYNLVDRYGNQELPVLLKHFIKENQKEARNVNSLEDILNAWNPTHFIPEKYLNLIKSDRID